jgi:geranylgeranyl diphosphate synthase type II
MDFEGRRNVTIPEYLEMISLKTAVLLGASLEMGGMLAGASEEETRRLFEFGKAAGIAFQLQDDYLDAFGDPEKFGKKVGGDIQANKKTFLILRALEKAEGQMRSELENMYFNPASTEAELKIKRVKEIFEHLNIPEESLQKSEAYFQEAEEHLRNLNLPSDKKEGLREFLDSLQTRKH